jgi:Carboxypeptidase regulatory-like domain
MASGRARLTPRGRTRAGRPGRRGFDECPSLRHGVEGPGALRRRNGERTPPGPGPKSPKSPLRTRVGVLRALPGRYESVASVADRNVTGAERSGICWLYMGLAAGTSERLWAADAGSVTDAQGLARLWLVAGRWLLAVDREGHQRQTAVVVHALARPGMVDVALDDRPPLVGVVVAKRSGAPIAGAYVALSPLRFDKAPEGALYSVITDVRGRFALHGMSSGASLLLVSAPSYSAHRRVLEPGARALTFEGSGWGNALTITIP